MRSGQDAQGTRSFRRIAEFIAPCGDSAGLPADFVLHARKPPPRRLSTIRAGRYHGNLEHVEQTERLRADAGASENERCTGRPRHRYNRRPRWVEDPTDGRAVRARCKLVGGDGLVGVRLSDRIAPESIAKLLKGL